MQTTRNTPLPITHFFDAAFLVMKLGAVSKEQKLDVGSGRVAFARGLVLSLLEEFEKQGRNDIRLQDLFEVTRLSKSSLSETVAKLVNEGFITKTPIQNDYRATALKLTDLAKQVMNEQAMTMNCLWNDLLRDVPTDDQEVFWQVVSALRSKGFAAVKAYSQQASEL